MIERPSPNHGPRAKKVDMLLVHYTGMPSARAALDRLTDSASRVSVHYLIDEDGTAYRLVPEDRRAWHAGVAFWGGERDINSVSIGIELVNPGHEFGYRRFPEAQMAALEALATDIVQRHRIAKPRVLGHSDVAPRRKQDPGELFDWSRLARAGVGLWPRKSGAMAGPSFGPGDRSGEIAEAQCLLHDFGYEIVETGVFGEETMAVITAFQRHFRQERVDGRLDAETLARIRAVSRHAG
jgi:N-acetylmuramoyl-L-alanine amidase